jgi:hypothetical protein
VAVFPPTKKKRASLIFETKNRPLALTGISPSVRLLGLFGWADQLGWVLLREREEGA